VQTVIVVKRCGNTVNMKDGRDVWWKEAWEGAPNTHKAKAFDSEHPLFILYTSGSTGKPKGVLHERRLPARREAHLALRFRSQGDRSLLLLRDIGWGDRPTATCLRPASNGATVFIYEGAPNQPEPDRSGR